MDETGGCCPLYKNENRGKIQVERGKERREKRRQEKKSILGSAQSWDWKHTTNRCQQYAFLTYYYHCNIPITTILYQLVSFMNNNNGGIMQ